MGFFQGMNVRGIAAAPMPGTAVGVLYALQQHLFRTVAVSGNGEGGHGILHQVGRHGRAVHEKVNGIRVIFSIQVDVFQDGCPVCIVGRCTDHTVKAVQGQFYGRVHINAHIGNRHMQHGVHTTDSKE